MQGLNTLEFSVMSLCRSAKVGFLTGLVLIAGAGALWARIPDRSNISLREAKHSKGVNEAVVGIVERILQGGHVQRGRGGSKTSASLGLRVYEGDKFLTDKNRIHVRYKDGTYVEIGEESSFELERMRFKPANPLPNHKASNQYDETVFRFLYGVVRITAPDVDLLEHFVLKTANAVVTATGPVDFFIIQLMNERDMTIRVARGKVVLMNSITNESMEVSEGTGAYLKVTGVINKTGPLVPDQLAFLKSRTRI